MATISKHGPGWRVQIRRRGYPKLSATFPLRKQAEQWAAQRESEIVHGRLGILPKHTLREALVKFREEKADKRRGGRWEKNRIKLLERDPVAQVLLGGINSSHLSDLRDRELARINARTNRPIDPATVRRIFSLLASVFKACREWRWLVHNPFLDFDRPPPKQGRRRGIRQAEIDALVLSLGYAGGTPATASQQVAVAFLLAVETGMRAGEILSLTWDQIHPKHAHLERTKNGDERDVPLSGRARELVEAMKGVDGVRVFTVDGASRDALFRDARKRAGLSGFTFHDSRSEAISRLSKRLDILELAVMVGHRDLNSLRHYYRANAEDLADKL